MNRIVFTLLVALFGLKSGQAQERALSDSVTLSNAQISSNKEAALKGDIKAARLLDRHYSLGVYDVPTSLKWAEYIVSLKDSNEIDKSNLEVLLEVTALSKSNLVETIKDAKSGDKSSAVSLGNHYWCIKKDFKEALFWFEVAAYRGDYLDGDRYRNALNAVILKGGKSADIYRKRLEAFKEFEKRCSRSER